MDFSLTTMFVVPVSNTLPTSGSTQDLAAGKFGVFDNAYATASSGTIAAKPYIYLAQGRNISAAGLGSKKSDKIAKGNVTEWYKVVAETDVVPQISELSNFTVQCGEEVTLTVRLHSKYIETGFYNGLTRSVFVQAPCCACGADPCTDLDPDALVTSLVNKANADPLLSQYMVFEKTGSGSSSKIKMTGKTLTSNSFTDPGNSNAFPYDYDRMWFRAFVRTGPATTQDFEVDDRCDTQATFTVTQRSSFPRGTAKEISDMERRYHSYQTIHKHTFNSPAYNQFYVTNVDSTKYYDTYVIKFRAYEVDTWYQGANLDERVIVAFPTTEGSTFETLLTAYLGAPTNYSAADITTTTTTSTSSTTTTSTTVLQP